MKLRSLLALLLLSLPTATGCVLEVDEAGDHVAAWGQPLEAAEQEEWAADQDLDLPASSDLEQPAAGPGEAQWAEPAGEIEHGEEGFTPWQDSTSPFPDPWMRTPDDGSSPGGD